MAINVRFIATLKEITGTEMVKIDSSVNTFEKVMTELLKLFPQLKDELFYPDGTLHFTCHFLLNGLRLSWPEDKAKKVKSGDELVFMVFVAGG